MDTLACNVIVKMAVGFRYILKLCNPLFLGPWLRYRVVLYNRMTLGVFTKALEDSQSSAFDNTSLIVPGNPSPIPPNADTAFLEPLDALQ